jgi:hypothetical protein
MRSLSVPYAPFERSRTMTAGNVLDFGTALNPSFAGITTILPAAMLRYMSPEQSKSEVPGGSGSIF